MTLSNSPEALRVAALAICQTALGGKQCPCTESGQFKCGDEPPGDYARAILAALDPIVAEAVARERWQPIETAPKDGTLFDAWCVPVGISGTGEGRVTDCWWFAGRFWNFDYNAEAREVFNLTHWQPLPVPPAAIRETET